MDTLTRAPPISNPAGISDDWTSLILAIDYLLVLDNEEWSNKLAVLTREALYLLEPETGEPDPLMPFGRTWWRIAVKDISDVQYVAAERSLRICTTARSKKSTLGSSPLPRPPLQKPLPRAQGCPLGPRGAPFGAWMPTRSCAVALALASALARRFSPIADAEISRQSPGTSNLFERDAQLAEAPKSSDIRRWHGVLGAVWHELTGATSALKTAFESCLPGDLPSLSRRRV